MKRQHGGDIYSYKEDIIDFSSNINPLGVTRGIACAVRDSIKDIVRYPDMECKGLRKAIAQRENTDYENIICGSGAAELIFNIVYTLKPERVLLTAPSFTEYEQAADAADAHKVYFYLKEENRFEINEDILEYIDENTDMVFICNPNNPTGTCTDRETVKRIVDKCREYNAFAVVDECFMDFVEENEKYSVSDLINHYDNMMVLKAFTKLYAMPGLRLGYGMCTNRDLILKMYSKRQPWNVSVCAQAAGLAALNETELPQKTREYIKRERRYITQGLKRLKIKFFDSKANFILFRADKGLDKRLLDYNILIRECGDYTGLDKSYYRIAVKTHIENERLLAALEAVLHSH